MKKAIKKIEMFSQFNSNCKICGGRINSSKDTIVKFGNNLVHIRCVPRPSSTDGISIGEIPKEEENPEIHVIYCANCDWGPVMLEKLEDRERTRCKGCGVYMHDGYEE